MLDRSYEFWAPPQIWKGETAYLLAGGPSLAEFDVERLRGRHVIAINSSCHRAPWAEILFFHDNAWFETHREIVEAWSGLVVSVSRAAKGTLPDKIHRVQIVDRLDFMVGHSDLKFGRSSGHTAISLAVALGAGRIVLLGYDMRLVDGRSHHHDDYSQTDEHLYSRDFLVHFTGWQAAAEAAGVEIVNATPNSALREFPMMAFDDIPEERGA
jgi:hypothetical protein